MADLYDEFPRCCPSQAEIDTMITAGISAATIAAVGMTGVTNVAFMVNQFEFGGDTKAMIVPAYDTDALIDLIAVDAARPARFARLIGRAWCLGQAFDYWEPTSPLPVWRTPLTWLRKGADGIVILDWAKAYWNIPDRNLIAEDEHHGQQIRKLMRPDPWRGEVMLRKHKDLAA